MNVTDFAQSLVDKINNYLKTKKSTVFAKINNIPLISVSEKYATVECVFRDKTINHRGEQAICSDICSFTLMPMLVLMWHKKL